MREVQLAALELRLGVLGLAERHRQLDRRVLGAELARSPAASASRRPTRRRPSAGARRAGRRSPRARPPPRRGGRGSASAWRTSASPASVSRTPRALRCTRMVPVSRSSAAICCETADCVKERASAAAEKEPLDGDLAEDAHAADVEHQRSLYERQRNVICADWPGSSTIHLTPHTPRPLKGQTCPPPPSPPPLLSSSAPPAAPTGTPSSASPRWTPPTVPAGDAAGGRGRRRARRRDRDRDRRGDRRPLPPHRRRDRAPRAPRRRRERPRGRRTARRAARAPARAARQDRVTKAPSPHPRPRRPAPPRGAGRRSVVAGLDGPVDRLHRLGLDVPGDPGRRRDDPAAARRRRPLRDRRRRADRGARRCGAASPPCGPTRAQLRRRGCSSACCSRAPTPSCRVAEQEVPSSIAALLIGSVPLWVILLRAAHRRPREPARRRPPCSSASPASRCSCSPASSPATRPCSACSPASAPR